MASIALSFLSCLPLLCLGVVHANLKCSEDGFFKTNSTFGKNRNSLLSSLSSNVITNGGFYNASAGINSDRVYAVALCRRGFEREACLNCVEKVSRNLIKQCPRQIQAYSWDSDENDEVSCLVRYSNHYKFGELVLRPLDANPNPSDIITSNMTLFDQEWEATINRTLEAASTADNSSRLKFYGVRKAALTEFQNVFVLMQCTPDLLASDCKRCLVESVSHYQGNYRGKKGGEVARPSCFFRWDLYAFYGAFDNVSTVPAPPRPVPQPPTGNDQAKDAKAKKGSSISSRTVAIIAVPTVVNIFVFSALIYQYSRRRKAYTKFDKSADSDGSSMLRFDLGTILTATDDFSVENKLGQGGFGPVYKGILPNGQEIAVKRMAGHSGQGNIEFKNEVLLLTRLQHRNLVKLLGFCLEGDEELLVYEFVSNSSLDNLIFDPDKRSLLTWNLRYKIIEGIVRGLLYLHEDSQLRIIHRDLKASNILLDAEMNPKISDFGMARLFNMDETRGVTSRVVGTYGYMAPEYVRHGQFSVKSDVYSFGVLILEIISGQKNRDFEQEGLPAFAWKRWNEGKPADIIDPILHNSQETEIMKCIHISLLCVQENVARRPTMNSIITWLGSETTTMPVPTAAAFTINSLPETDTSSSRLNRSSASNQSRDEGIVFSLNEVSITELDPR